MSMASGSSKQGTTPTHLRAPLPLGCVSAEPQRGEGRDPIDVRRVFELVARFNHELRTPLNAVIGFADLLQSDPRDPLSTRQAVGVQAIKRAGTHMLGLMEDLLDLSLARSGRLRVGTSAVVVSGLIDESLQAVQLQALARRIALVPPGLADAEICVMADPLRLRQVMLNLLTNAIKYNIEGGVVRIGVTRTADHVQIQVMDTGYGMSPQQMAHLFEPFNRLGREHEDGTGTGIGMALTLQLIEAMGGTIDVASRRNEGTTVRVCLRSA